MPSIPHRHVSLRRALVLLCAFLIAVLGVGAPLVASAEPTPTASGTPSATPTPEEDAAAKKADPSETPKPDGSATPDKRDVSPTPSPSAEDSPSARTARRRSPRRRLSPDREAVDLRQSYGDADPEADETAAGDGDVGTLAVPPATGNNAVITVKVGGDRTGTHRGGDLAGVVLGLSTTRGDRRRPVGHLGHLHLRRRRRLLLHRPEHPDRGRQPRPAVLGASRSAPPRLATPTPRSAPAPRPPRDPYRFQTGDQLQAGNTYRSTANFMVATGNTTTRRPAASGRTPATTRPSRPSAASTSRWSSTCPARWPMRLPQPEGGGQHVRRLPRRHAVAMSAVHLRARLAAGGRDQQRPCR